MAFDALRIGRCVAFGPHPGPAQLSIRAAPAIHPGICGKISVGPITRQSVPWWIWRMATATARSARASNGRRGTRCVRYNGGPSGRWNPFNTVLGNGLLFDMALDRLAECVTQSGRMTTVSFYSHYDTYQWPPVKKSHRAECRVNKDVHWRIWRS